LSYTWYDTQDFKMSDRSFLKLSSIVCESKRNYFSY
jgi:hypothetical protein